MKNLIFFSFLIYIFSYNKKNAVSYALRYAEFPNHICGNYLNCTPCSYFGDEACNYTKQGGDSANFVSQCLVLGGGHPGLNGSYPCNGNPCGFEVINQKDLGNCLEQRGWISTCGYLQSPPSNIQAGDVIIYYSSKCNSTDAHATFITEGGSHPKITGHSNIKINLSYDAFAQTKPYYNWLHYNCPLTTQDGKCVSTCPDETYLFSLNNSCLESCPHNYKIINNECKFFNSFDENTTISEFKNRVVSNITSYVNSSKVIIGVNFKAIILQSNDMEPKELLEKNLSGFDLGICSDVLKEYYNISKDENLIVLYMEINNDKSQKNDFSNKSDKSFNLEKINQIEINNIIIRIDI